MHELVVQVSAAKDLAISTLPYSLNIPKQPPIRVMAILRHLPEKRVTAWAHWQHKLVIVKFFIAKQRAKQHFEREYQGMLAFERAHIDSAPILYAGLAWPDTYMIITGFLIGARSFTDCFQSVRSVAQLFAVSLLESVAKMHHQGIIQADLHGGNFIYWQGRWHCVDGDGVINKSTKNKLTQKAIIENISLACYQLITIFPQINLTALAASIKSYYPGITHLEKKIHQGTKKMLLDRQHNVMRKAKRVCSEFGVVKDKKQTIYYHKPAVASDETSMFLQALKSEHTELCLNHGKELLKSMLISKQQYRSKDMLRNWQYNQLLIHQRVPVRAYVAWEDSFKSKKVGKLWVRSYHALPFKQVVTQHLQYNLDLTPLLLQVVHIYLRLQQLRLSYARFNTALFEVNQDGRVLLTNVDNLTLHRFDVGLKRATTRSWQSLIKDFEDNVSIVAMLQTLLSKETLVKSL